MKKLFTIIISSLLLLSFAIVSCEKEDLGTATIYGVVSDKVTGEPVKSADVELLPVGIKTRTGTDGHYEFNNLKAGNYQICINLTNYQDVQSQIELGIGQSLRRDVSMELLPPALRVVNDSRQDISELNFGTAKTDVSRSFNIFNEGAETLKWKITYTADWIKSVSITEGVLNRAETESIIVIIDRSVLTEEQNITTLHITSNNGSKQLTLKVGDFPEVEEPSDNNNSSDEDNPSNVGDLPTFNFNAAKYYVYPDAGAMDWDNAMAYCDKVNFAGYDDWYLPTSKELKAMFENKTAIGGFTTSGSSKNDYYWSSSEYANPLAAYYKRFNQYGAEGSIAKDEVLRVRCVRKNNTPSYEYSPTAVSRLEDLPTFNYNAAKYYVYPDAGAMDWDNAMAYCDKVNVAGYDDWYLPNVKESNAMYENRTTIGGFKTSVTGKAGWYWTGEEYANPLGAYYKMFNKYIGDGSEAKEEVLRVRCVRRD